MIYFLYCMRKVPDNEDIWFLLIHLVFVDSLTEKSNYAILNELKATNH